MKAMLAEKKPKYAQLQEQLAHRIRRGELTPGDRLPTFAEMRENFGATATTVQRVYAALEQDGFITRQNGRGTFVAEPTRCRTGLLGFVSDASNDLAVFPYWVQLMQSVRQAAEAQGRHLVMLRSNSHIEAWKQVEGVLLTSANQLPAAASLPAVSVFSRDDAVTSVLADEAQGIRDMVQHLLFLGHRRIAYLATDDARLGRLAAYRQGLREAGIMADERWVRYLLNETPENERLAGFSAKGHYMMQRWLEEDWRELGCTALLAHNDETAIGAMEALHEAGLRVPQDVSVVGFDGTEVSTLSSPKLTTVEVPLREIGTQAVSLLLHQIKGAPPSEQPNILPTTVRVRASSAPPQR